MPDPGGNDNRTRHSEGPMLNATALRSTKAGFLALGIVSFALATFGPWFNLLMGYGLMVFSMTVAIVGIWWADRSAGEVHRKPALTNGIFAKAGAALSVLALIVSTYFFFFQAEDGIRDLIVTGVQTLLFRSQGPLVQGIGGKDARVGGARGSVFPGPKRCIGFGKLAREGTRQ